MCFRSCLILFWCKIYTPCNLLLSPELKICVKHFFFRSFFSISSSYLHTNTHNFYCCCCFCFCFCICSREQKREVKLHSIYFHSHVLKASCFLLAWISYVFLGEFCVWKFYNEMFKPFKGNVFC